MLVRHPVADYDAWRRAHDAFADERRGMGAIGEAVYQSLDDPHDVTIATDFETAHAARSFAASEQLRERMGAAGVAGTPELWLVSER